jgi:putative ABC transport system permease protein
VVAQGGPMGEALARSLSADLGRPVHPVWHLKGTMGTRDGAVELQDVHLYGVRDDFWATWRETPPPKGVHRMNAALSSALARQGAGHGDLVFRGRPLSALARDTPLAATSDELTPLAIWGSPYEGLPSRLGAPQEATEPRNVFVELAWLQEQLDLGATSSEIWVPGTGVESDKVVHRSELSLLRHFKPTDVGLVFTERRGGVSVRSESLLLPKAVAKRAMTLPHRRAHLTWFVDTVSSDKASVPFSFVSAVEAPDARELRELEPGEALVNQWLADDLQLKVGDALSLRYHRVEDAASGVPNGEASVTVAGILPMRGLGADRTLTPDFPGITTAKRCRDWDPGVAMDRQRIRERDEQYWQLHGASPKIILPLESGRALWGSRFGDLNEVLLREADSLAAAANVLAATTPSSLGIHVQNMSSGVLVAETPATDFGTLFLGFSFVLILASLLLTAMLFGLGIDRRATEVITLRRIGLPEATIRSLYQREALTLATVAMLGSIALAPVLSGWTVSALHTLWPESIGGISIPTERSWTSMLMGTMVSGALVFGVQWHALRRALRGASAVEPTAGSVARCRVSVLFFGAVIGALVALGSAPHGVAPDAAFFGLGAAFLIGALSGLSGLLSTPPRGRPWASLMGLAIRGLQRSPSRSVTVIVSLALASFLVVGVGAHAPSSHGQGRVDGATGGFALMVETTTGLSADVRHVHGREHLGLLEEDLQGVTLWPVRVRAGDDASCLSPGRAKQPRMLGLDSDALATRGAFTALGASDSLTLWSQLSARTPTGAIPIVGDEATLRWGLGLGVGDQLSDLSETGEPVTYEVIGIFERSFLQGAVITAERHLAELYPRSSETRLVLVELDGAQEHKVSQVLKSALGDLGARVRTTPDQLARFSRVETSYVRIFLAFGLLGVLLGAAGVSVLLARNALARRREFATLRAIGQSRVSVWLYLTVEHFALILVGLSLGSTAAFVGLWPSMAERSHEAPLAALMGLAGIVVLSMALTSVVAWRCLDEEPADVLTSIP